MKSLSQKINESLNESMHSSGLEVSKTYMIEKGDQYGFTVDVNESNSDLYSRTEKHWNSLSELDRKRMNSSVEIAPQDADYVGSKFKDIPKTYQEKLLLSFDDSVNESLSASDLVANKTYLVKKGKIEAYAEYKESKGGKHFFNNSGETIEISDSELGKCVVNEAVNESKVDQEFNDIEDGAGWCTADYVLTMSGLNPADTKKLLLKLAKAGILADEDKLKTGEEESKSDVPKNAWMTSKDVEDIKF